MVFSAERVPLTLRVRTSTSVNSRYRKCALFIRLIATVTYDNAISHQSPNRVQYEKGPRISNFVHAALILCPEDLERIAVPLECPHCPRQTFLVLRRIHEIVETV